MTALILRRKPVLRDFKSLYRGFISGVVTEQNVPVSRRVMCFHRKSARLISITYSGEDGRYTFKNLVPASEYFITSIDDNNDGIQYNAVTQDLIIASEVES